MAVYAEPGRRRRGVVGEKGMSRISPPFAPATDPPPGDRRSALKQGRREFWVERFWRARTGIERPGKTTARPPEQPVSGPGGKRYAHLRVLSRSCGSGATAYWIFEPAAPSPRRAPVVVFLHGWGGTDPVLYGAWLDHLVRRGSIVLFPVYQRSVRSEAGRALKNTVLALRDAYRSSSANEYLHCDWNRCAVIGHSAGGVLAAQIAAIAVRAQIPQPRAVMAIHPSRGQDVRRPLPRISLRPIPASTLFLIVVGQDDHAAGDREGRFLFLQTPQIPRENKNFVTVVSDFHGNPPLVANHIAPVAPRSGAVIRLTQQGELSHQAMLDLLRLKGNRVDALHYYGYWKLADALIDAAFYGINREYALGDAPRLRHMGTWSDGTPVAKLLVTTPYVRRH